MPIPILRPSPTQTSNLARTGRRFEIFASCRFWWTAPEHQPHFGSGRISNLSVAGVFVNTPVIPPVGASIMLEIDLPRPPGAAHPEQSFLLLAAEGKVLRHHPQKAGFATRITHASFISDRDVPHE